MSKIPEKFQYLSETGEALLHRLYYSRNIFSVEKNRPIWMKDAAAGKVLKQLVGKFPEFPEQEKIQGYEILTARAKVLHDELEQHYETFVDCADWRDATLALLTEVANSTSILQLDLNPVLTTSWLDLMVLYVRLHVLASLVGDKRTILAVYYKMFFVVRSTAEVNYQRLAKWVIDFEAPFKKLQDEFRSINDAVGKVLISLTMPYMKARTINSLRKDGALNVTLKPEDMAKPVHDQSRFELSLASKMNTWIVYGFLCTPGAFALAGSIDLAKFAVSEGYLTPVFRDISVPLGPEFSSLFGTYKSKTLKLATYKKSIKEAAVASIQDAGRRHLERRIYVRQELEALLHLFTDRPQLLGPKFQVLVAALSLAKEEVFWYFRHTDTAPPDKLKKTYKSEEFKDKKISHLIYLIDAMIAHVRAHRNIVTNYYMEYLTGADLQGLSHAMDANFMSSAGPTLTKLADAITESLQQISGQSHPHFQALRDNWLRLEVAMSSASSPVPFAKYKALAHRFHLVYQHSRAVDQFEAILEEYGDLRALWYYKDSIFGIPPLILGPGQSKPTDPSMMQGVLGVFDYIIADGPEQPLHVSSFLRLLSIFPSNATQFWPEERDIIGDECVIIANTCLTKIATAVVGTLSGVANFYIKNEYQLQEYNAALPLLMKRKEWKPPTKDWQPPADPGTESFFRNRAALENIRVSERNANQLCTSLNEMLEIAIHDQLFVPREFLRDGMAIHFRNFLRKAVLPTGDNIIQRPSILELQIKTYLHVFTLVENYIDMDVGDMLREVLLGEAYMKPIGKLGRVDWFPDTEMDYRGSMGGALATFYSEFVAKRMTQGVCYAPLRLSVVSRSGVAVGQGNFRPEDYTDIIEMRALARLIGPYGMKLVERELLRVVVNNTAFIKEALVLNSSVLEEIASLYHKEARCAESLRKLRETDQFVQRSVAVGNALAFRRLIKEATRDVAQNEVPHLVSVVRSMYQQYTNNTFMFPDLLPVDSIACDLGINADSVDQPLKVMLSRTTSETDKRLWELLPVLYACAFVSSIHWREAQYRPQIDGYLNNIHSMTYAINDLILAYSFITGSATTDADIASLMLKFVEISSVLLLRVIRAKQDKSTPVDMPSVLIFMDKFVEESTMLTEDMLEKCLPYTLLRNMYKNLYEDRVVSSKETNESF